MKRLAYAAALVLSGVSSVALAANVPLAIRNEIHHCGCVGCCAQANNQPPPFTPRSTDYTGTTFAYDISDGRWWVAADSFRGFSARKQCDIDTRERYGHGMCNHDTKKGAKPMIVAMGYDIANQRYQMVSNAESRQNKPERILKQCQKQGYTDCQVVFDGNIRQ